MSDPHAGPDPREPAGPGGVEAATTGDHVGGDAHAVEAEEHGHGESLGPIDWAAWGAGLIGLLIGLGTAVAFAITTNRIG